MPVNTDTRIMPPAELRDRILELSLSPKPSPAAGAPPIAAPEYEGRHRTDNTKTRAITPEKVAAAAEPPASVDSTVASQPVRDATLADVQDRAARRSLLAVAMRKAQQLRGVLSLGGDR